MKSKSFFSNLGLAGIAVFYGLLVLGILPHPAFGENFKSTANRKQDVAKELEGIFNKYHRAMLHANIDKLQNVADDDLFLNLLAEEQAFNKASAGKDKEKWGPSPFVRMSQSYAEMEKKFPFKTFYFLRCDYGVGSARLAYVRKMPKSKIDRNSEKLFMYLIVMFKKDGLKWKVSRVAYDKFTRKLRNGQKARLSDFYKWKKSFELE